MGALEDAMFLAATGLLALGLAIRGEGNALEQGSPEPLPSIALPSEIERVLRDYERGWQGRDTKALAELFAEDGFVMSNGKPPVRGRAAIEAAYDGSGGPLSLRALAYAVEGNVGYIIGGYGPERGKPDTGKFVLALRRGKDGRWMIAADMDNSNRRSSAPTAPATSPSGE
jgi:ketosteroid isomerase-like protein